MGKVYNMKYRLDLIQKSRKNMHAGGQHNTITREQESTKN